MVSNLFSLWKRRTAKAYHLKPKKLHITIKAQRYIREDMMHPTMSRDKSPENAVQGLLLTALLLFALIVGRAGEFNISIGSI